MKKKPLSPYPNPVAWNRTMALSFSEVTNNSDNMA
jgi:hypothetical protein